MNILDKLLKKAEKALRKRKYEETIKDFRLYLEINPRSVKICSDLAFSHNKLGEYDKAIDSCIHALEAEPNYKEALNNLFFAYDQKGDYDKALEILNQYINIHPITNEQAINAHQNIIFYSENKFLLKLDKKFPKKSKDWKQSDLQNTYKSQINEILPSINPNIIIPLNFLCFFKFSNIIKSEKEIDVLKLMLEKSQEKFRVLNKLGLAYANRKNYSKSVEFFNQSLEINPEVVETWMLLGDVYFQMREFNKAIDKFKQAIKIDPETRDAWMKIGNSYLELGKCDNAIDTLKKALEIYPSAKKIKEHLSEISPNIEKSNVKIIYKIESTKYIWYHLAQAYYEMQKYDKALDACNRSLKINPNFEKALVLKDVILAAIK